MPDVSLLCSSILPCSPSPIHIDARMLCEAARSLKRLTLGVHRRCTSEALAEVFGHRPLEDLHLTLDDSAVEVSSAC